VAVDPSDTQIDQFVTTRELPSGGDDRYLRHKKLDRNIAPGPYYIGSMLDVTAAVPETNEANNTLDSPSTIILTPGSTLDATRRTQP
jgi:hypothetical protein